MTGALVPPVSLSVWSVQELWHYSTDIVQNGQSSPKTMKKILLCQFTADGQWLNQVFAKSLYFAKCCVLIVDVW